MRENLSEQELTDYALNELDFRARVYTESLLAVSEEARQDVAETIEMTRLLERGYERELVTAELKDLSLRPAQRLDLIGPHFIGRCVIRDVAAALALAACVAFVFTKVDGEAFVNARQVTGTLSARIVDRTSPATNAADDLSLAAALARFAQSPDDNSESTAPTSDSDLPEPTIICTPPQLIFNGSVLTGAH